MALGILSSFWVVARYDWVWDGSWTNELEEAVLNLLVALDDAFATDGGVLAEPGGCRMHQKGFEWWIAMDSHG